MLFELFLGAFGAYVATTGIRGDVSVLEDVLTERLSNKKYFGRT
jgi:hypothetical protein